MMGNTNNEAENASMPIHAGARDIDEMSVISRLNDSRYSCKSEILLKPLLRPLNRSLSSGIFSVAWTAKICSRIKKIR